MQSDIIAFNIVMDRFDEYCYLEIGSYKGGSLLGHLLNPKCKAAYSIDIRTNSSKNNTNNPDTLDNNTTEDMLWRLEDAGADISKLKCHDGTIHDISEGFVEKTPNICLIDGEHTNKAAEEDFNFCYSLCKDGVIMFHDKDHVKAGIEAALRKMDAPYTSYDLSTLVRAIEVGGKDRLK